MSLINAITLKNTNMDTIETLKLALKEANETIELQRQMILSLDNQLIELKKPTENNLEFKVGQELEFNVYGNIIKGKFLSIRDGNVINIEVTFDDSYVTEIGCTGNVHKSFLTNPKTQ